MKRAMMVLLMIVATGCAKKSLRVNKGESVKSSEDSDSRVEPVEETVGVADKALGILKAKCSGCHSETQESCDFGFVMDVNRMLASGTYLVAGEPEKSLIYQRTDPKATGTMPPPAGLDENDRQALHEWIRTLADPTGIEKQALALLNNKCVSCHNPQKGDGGFSYVTDVERMIGGKKYIVLDDIENSLLYKRTDRTTPNVMPPGAPLSTEERGLLLQWLKMLKSEDVKNYALSDADFLKVLKNDLEKNVPIGARPGTRYFTLHHLKVARVGEARLEVARQAFAKVVNSLSTVSAVIKPVAIDADKLIYRLNLFDINMPVATFDAFMSGFNLFTVDYGAVGQGAGDPTYEFLVQEMGTKFFSARLDWFTSTATMPIPYQRLLRLPNTLGALQAELGVDAVRGINGNAVHRAGFANSGVSSKNRVIERHVSGANRFFWESYDFLNNEGIHNIFARPLGPSSQAFEPPFDQLFADVAFTQDGGEMIFQLPNGFLGYYLSNGVGNYIHKGPVDVVRNKNGPESFLLGIVNGFSCMDCHKNGLLNKTDQVRPFAMMNDIFSPEALDKILKLYPEAPTFTNVVNQDSLVFQNALKAAGIDTAAPEDPVKTTLLNYYEKLSLLDVAAELGISQSEVLSLLRVSPFREDWAILSFPAGTILREQLNKLFGLAKKTTRPGLDYLVPIEGDFFVTTTCMQANPLLMDACISRNFGGLELPPPEPSL